METTNLNIKKIAIHEHGVPFELKLGVPSEATIAAIEEGRRIISDPTTPKYSDMDSLKAALE